MEKHVLSKSTFIRGVQCLKSLYLNKKRPFLRDRMPKERLIVFQRGHQVGELAQQLFPGGINMSPGHPGAFRQAIINTEKNILAGYPVIYEAAFQFDQVMIFLDILVHTGTGWHAYEVKSSGGISDTYLMDAALQFYVIKGTGLDISGISLVHIDKEYTLDGEIDPKGLFKIVDVTGEALSRQEFVQEQISREKEALAMDHSPKIDVGPHCREPYDCDFIGHCWKNIPKPPQKEAEKQIDIAAARVLFDRSDYNMAFIKLLPMRPAIPIYQGTHPYQEIPYGYCLSAGNEPKTGIYPHETNPEIKLLGDLKSQLAGKPSLICFGQGYLLKNLLPEYQNIIDLKNLIPGDSDFYTELKDKSEMERLRVIYALQEGVKLPEYVSDAVAEHFYLTEFSNDVGKRLKDYASAWYETMRSFAGYLETV